MIAALQPIQPKPEIFYPESDDEPLAESDLHALETMALFFILSQRFKDEADVYVAMDNFLYYEQGNPAACVSPDVYVVKGVAKHSRRSYKTWEENGRTPNVVFEITSESSKRLDLGKKKRRYQKLGVAEYILFDVLGEYLRPALQGFRLEAGAYVPVLPDKEGELLSEQLALKFSVDGDGLLRIRDCESGKILARAEVLYDALDRAEERRKVSETELSLETAARLKAEKIAKTAEAEIARLKEELARLKNNRL